MQNPDQFLCRYPSGLQDLFLRGGSAGTTHRSRSLRLPQIYTTVMQKFISIHRSGNVPRKSITNLGEAPRHDKYHFFTRKQLIL